MWRILALSLFAPVAADRLPVCPKRIRSSPIIFFDHCEYARNLDFLVADADLDVFSPNERGIF